MLANSYLPHNRAILQSLLTAFRFRFHNPPPHISTHSARDEGLRRLSPKPLGPTCSVDVPPTTGF
jgi:hypothetical protein